MIRRDKANLGLQGYILGYTRFMNSLSLATSALDDLAKEKAPQRKKANSEVASLLIQFQRLVELSERIAPTLLIRNNEWIVQVKGLRQHYLFDTEDGLTQIEKQSMAALEIGLQGASSVQTLFTVNYSSTKGFILRNERKEAKGLAVAADDPELVAKVMGYIR